VYDLLLVPPALADGVRRGFRTNSQRAAEHDQNVLFDRAGVRPVRLWATGDPLPPEACRVHLRASVPGVVEAGANVELNCTVENAGAALLVSAPPNPVRLSYKWLEPDSGRWLDQPEALRTRLPHTLVPRRPAGCRLSVRAPARPGYYLLRITLVQEEVAWFDELHSENAMEHAVTVVPRAPAWKRLLGQALGHRLRNAPG
jgi:hypothetical protein